MYFGNSDIELLRLAAWCKNLPANLSDMLYSQEPASQVFDAMSVKFLIQLGLINVTRTQPSIRLREKGWRFLRYLGYQYHKDTKYRYNERRVEAARILLTFWRAGFQVFASSLDDLGKSQVYLSSMAARRDTASDVWGGAVFWGLARLRNNAIACYYVEDGRELRMNYRGERFTLDKAALRFSMRESMLLAGSSYVKLARAVRNNGASNPPDKETELTLPQIRQTASHPLYLLECGTTGALQLLIMSIEGYRKKLAAAMFRTQDMANRVTPPPPGVTDADGMVGGVGPWIVAFDMDIRRIDRACRQTLNAGFDKLTILCLNARAEAALKLLYGTEHTNILVVPEDRLVSAFGVLRPYAPAPDVYVDERGGIIDAAHLPVD